MFESHLAYGITVWGGVSKNKLMPLFRAQKQCLRILFGDKDAYLDKFKTCARSRPFGNQKLGTEFYIRENSKPLFTEHKLMSVFSLYHYHSAAEAFKLLKFHIPISLYGLFTLPERPGKETFLLTSRSSDSFVYGASAALNSVRSKLKLTDFSITTSSFKTHLKAVILDQQSAGDEYEWSAYNNNNNKI